MNTIRRLYLYAVTLVSLEVVLWGVIGLARSVFAGAEIGGSATRLAGALSLILVGLPVFLLHWWLAQRSVAQDIEERSALLRAVFLYGALAGTLAPAVQNAWALLNRLLVVAFGLDPWRALVGGQQTWSDNLVAIALNALVAGYIFTVLRTDWKKSLQGNAYPETRRLSRYLWTLYGLGLTVFGVQQVLLFILKAPVATGPAAWAILANGLAMLLAGAPLWVFAWRQIQRSLVDLAEQGSLMRLVVLYTLSFISVGTVLLSTGLFLEDILYSLLDETISFKVFLGKVAQPLSVALSLGGVWAYYGRLLVREVSALSDTPRRSGLRRLYFYVFAFFGLLATFMGLQLVLSYVVDVSWNGSVVGESELRALLSVALATLLVGLPLWIFNWRPMAREAIQTGEAGDHARRSVVRRAYLYLILFAGVMGVMGSAGALIFQFLSALLGEPANNLGREAVQLSMTLALFAVLLAYHWQVLRTDSRLAAATLARRHALYPVLVLAPDDEAFAAEVVSALQKEAVGLPVAVHPYSAGVPDESLSAARLVILPGELVVKPSEVLRLWLQGFSGVRLVIPTPAEGWQFVSGLSKPLQVFARQTAVVVRQLAEGEAIAPPRESPPWIIVVYIAAGLFTLELLLGVVSLLISLFGNR